MFIVRVGAIGLASDTFISGKILLPEEEAGIYVLDHFLNGWVYMCFIIWCVQVEEGSQRPDRKELV